MKAFMLSLVTRVEGKSCCEEGLFEARWGSVVRKTWRVLWQVSCARFPGPDRARCDPTGTLQPHCLDSDVIGFRGRCQMARETFGGRIRIRWHAMEGVNDA